MRLALIRSGARPTKETELEVSRKSIQNVRSPCLCAIQVADWTDERLIPPLVPSSGLVKGTFHVSALHLALLQPQNYGWVNDDIVQEDHRK